VSHLTYAEIYDRKRMHKFVISSCNAAVFSNIFKSSNAKFFLIIYVDGKQFVKMHIYPLAENTVIKVIIEGNQISNDVLFALSNLASRMDIIHTSGFTIVDNHLIFEMYLAKTVAFQKFKEFQNELMKMKNINRVSLMEISPKHPSMRI